MDPITFRIVCIAIAKYAFITTDLPLIISLEVHCSIEQQKKMVDVSLLYISPTKTSPASSSLAA